MKPRSLIGLFLAGLALAVAAVATRAETTSDGKQWAIVNFPEKIVVNGRMLVGAYAVVHDDAKMARGEPCTTFYRFNAKKGPGQAAVSFHCIPAARAVAATATLTTKPAGLPWSRYGARTELVEYQFAGDAEGHGVPLF